VNNIRLNGIQQCPDPFARSAIPNIPQLPYRPLSSPTILGLAVRPINISERYPCHVHICQRLLNVILTIMQRQDVYLVPCPSKTFRKKRYGPFSSTNDGGWI
jgi:hypothetical protein